MELSYAQLALIEEALGKFFDYQESDWVCSTNSEITLNKDEVAHLVKHFLDLRAEASWNESTLTSVCF